ncbi:hypothetical protein SEUCBS140593_007926 [Sporothrix eucalyptigena]|uniref:NACHT domain-containing protein n=1 Tax=Sporothrix eucalyptigena TaxID=1812306 RepID=A0ABP0CIM2_9PEZI
MSRPTTTNQLVERLRDPGTDTKERAALQALATKMIEIFNEKKLLVQTREAAALAPVVTPDAYQVLLWAFVDAVTKGTADGGILQPQLCREFIHVLRCTPNMDRDGEVNPVDLKLGAALQSLQKRLVGAIQQAEPATQYQLVDTLAHVLDAMNDVKTKGLGREALHEPLVKQLGKLSKGNEVRLTQAARYAYQALLSISDDEGPYKALWRHTLTIVGAATKVTSSVSTMDPAKLFDGLVALQDVPELVSSIVEVVQSTSAATKGSRGGEELRLRSKPKSWYVALRYADMLTRAKAFSSLKTFFKDIPCRDDTNFLCGLYAQLEHQWEAATASERKAIQEIVRFLPPAKGSSDDCTYADTWREAVSCTLGRSSAASSNQPTRPTKHSFSAVLRKPKEYKCTIASLASTVRQTHRDAPLSTALLEKAWPVCDDAMLFYADAALRHYYLARDESLLQIQRISGQLLPMEQCYINLAIVEQTKKSTLLAQLNVEQSQETVMLADLFQPRKCADGQDRVPRRVMIRGRAGMGKTTLCKKIIYELTRTPTVPEFRIWADRYDRVIWLPLCHLKRLKADKSYRLTNLLMDQFFSQLPEAAHYARILAKQCSSRTLFLLDGYDEVSEVLDKDHMMFDFLEWLLSQPDVIVASRPGHELPPGLLLMDCDLETVGFYVDQVRAYVQNSIANTHKARNIQAFLHGRRLMHGLMRIPVQLDALCYIWNDKDDSTDGFCSTVAPTALNSMTSVYMAIEHKLWCKDMPRLTKWLDDGQLITERIAHGLRLPSQVYALVSGEINFLQSLAFAGFYHNVQDFEQGHRDYVYELMKPPRPKGLLDDVLARLSFLRISGSSSNSQLSSPHHTYHFIHLTYQEFFAAQYFVKYWIAGVPMPCPEFNSDRTRPQLIQVDAHEFLQQNKYRARYNIFWRFVAGLLRDHNKRNEGTAGRDIDTGSLLRFFTELDQEPRDILGPAHQRLVMCCMSEADPMQDMPHFDPHRDVLRRWMLYECDRYGRSRLVREIEFPHQIYDVALQSEPKNTKMIIFEIIGTGNTCAMQSVSYTGYSY